MYKSRIRAWGLDKKNKIHEIREILRQRAKREARGKKTIFILRGRAVDMTDVERYARRKRINLVPDNLSSPAARMTQELVSLTPPPSPPPSHTPQPLRDVENFLHSFNAFVQESLQSERWTLGKDVMGFACIVGVEYPATARDRFFLSVERGVKRYKLGDVSQAYRQWRIAFEDLQSIVRTRRPSQLLCLVELLAHLAECKGEVASLMLRYLGDLIGQCAHSDARISMLESLSRLNADGLAGLTRVSYDCSRNAFSKHFRRDSFFLLDCETILTESSGDSGTDSSPSLSGLVLGWDTYDVEALRAARSVMEVLMSSERYAEAEQITLIHIQRMHEMPFNGTVGGAFSHAYSYLTHLYLQTLQLAKAYQYTSLKVENYFRVIECRNDLPEDFILSSYSLLSSLAEALGMKDEAQNWRREHAILKIRMDALAERELVHLKSLAQIGSSDSVTAGCSNQEPQSSDLSDPGGGSQVIKDWATPLRKQSGMRQFFS